MKKFSELICKNKKIILIISSVLIILSFIGMSLTKVNYDILVYLPKDIETIKGQDILTNDFNMGAYSIAVIDNMPAKSVLKLEEKIKNVEGVNEVVSLYDISGNIPIEMLPNEIVDKLHNKDEDLLLITFSDSTSSEKTLSAVEKIRNITNGKLSQGGMSSMVLDTMNLSNKEIAIYVIIAVILCVFVLELSLDSYVIPFILLANIGCAILFNLGTNIFLGQISYITKALVAVLQLGVTTDFSIFLYHSYENKKKLTDKVSAMKDAIIETFTSVTGSSLTTIAGFLVLCTMQLTLGKDLGIVMAKGVLLGVICVLTLFPSLLLIFDKLIEKTKHKVLVPDFSKINKFVIKFHKVIFVCFLILLIPTYLAYKNVDVYYKLDKSLPNTLESIRTNEILKKDFNIVSSEMILIDKNMKIDNLLDMVNKIENIEGIDSVISYSKLKELGITENMIDTELLKIIESNKYQMMLVNSNYDVATDELNNQISEINKIVKQYDKKGIIAGEGPLTKDLIEICDIDFNNVNYSSILCIFIILIIVLKSFSLPILLILCIEFAIFNNMSISYFNVTVLPFIAPIVLGTIQLGATIDYAILMTTTYIKKRKEKVEKNKAMLETLNYCGHSIFISGMCFFAATFGVGIYSKIEMIGSLCTLISRGALISMVVVITILPSILLIFDKIILKTGFKERKINMTKITKKIAAVAIAIFLMILPFQALAITKNETVYSKLNNDGTVKNIIVNEQIINKDNLDTIKDYSELKDILNISNNNLFTQEKNNLTWNAFKKDVFYQGTINKKLPVETSIKYYLNNKEITLDDLLGKEGSVKIVIKYKNNDSHNVLINNKYETLYTPFVVTMATIFDNKNNSNIEITNGKVMSNGTKDIVSAIATPGLYQSLGFNELRNMDTITIKLNTTNFSLPTIYSVVTPKILDTNDLTIFNKIDDLYKETDLLQSKTDEIDSGAKKISEGTNKLASVLSESINTLKNDKKDALNNEQLSLIESNVVDSVKSTFTDEYKNNIATTAWNETKESLINSSDKTVENYGSNAIQIILSAYLGGQENLMYYGECISGNTDACTVLISKGFDINTTNTFAETLKLQLTKALNSTTFYIGENVSKSVAVQTAYTSSIQTSSNISIEVAKKVSNEVKNSSIIQTLNSLNELYENVEVLNTSMNTLSTGISEYNKEGINKISTLVNGEVKETTEKVKALGNLSNNYNSFANKLNNTKGETKFVLVVDSKKAIVETKVDIGITKKATLWDRIKNLFN